MKNGVSIWLVLVFGILALASARVAPSQITRFMILHSYDDNLIGITHDLLTSPVAYDTLTAEEDVPAGRVMQPLSPADFFDNDITSYGSLSFDYDTENKVAYFGSTGQWTLNKINIDGSGLEPIFSSEYVFVKHLNVDFESNTAYFSAYALEYVNRTAVLTAEFYFSTSSLLASNLNYVLVKANLLTGETEEMFKTIDIRALVFNNNYRLMFLVGYDDITVMTMDKTVVDVIPLPVTMSGSTSVVLYDRLEDVIYVVADVIFYVRYSAQESGKITVLGRTSSTDGYAWHDAENKAFYFMPYGSGASVYHFGYETFESLISASSYTATALFQITTSAYGLFAIACDGNSVVACGWNSSGLPTYMVAAIVLLIVLPCAGCIGFIVGACKRREMKFPEDQWANMPLNQQPEKKCSRTLGPIVDLTCK
jgi:hypothetical protein